MIGLVAYLALVVTLPALMLGHQGEAFPPLRWWRWARARKARARGCAPVSRPQSPSCGSRVTGAPPRASQAPSRPSWANTQPIKEN